MRNFEVTYDSPHSPAETFLLKNTPPPEHLHNSIYTEGSVRYANLDEATGLVKLGSTMTASADKESLHCLPGMVRPVVEKFMPEFVHLSVEEFGTNMRVDQFSPGQCLTGSVHTSIAHSKNRTHVTLAGRIGLNVPGLGLLRGKVESHVAQELLLGIMRTDVRLMEHGSAILGAAPADRAQNAA